jgi:hypothetical protein
MEYLHFPIIQFTNMADFIGETQNRPCSETCYIWPAHWTSGHDHVQTAWHGVTCQFITQNRNAQSESIVTMSLVIGTYQIVYGKPFGPDAERRLEIIQKHAEDARIQVENHLLDNLYAAWRLSHGSIFTGLGGNQIQPAYWYGFDHIYEELRAK